MYAVSADGYMSGKILSVEEIEEDDNNVTEFYKTANGKAEITDGLLQSIRSGLGGYSRNNALSPGGGETGQSAGVDEKPYYRKPRRSIRERLTDSGIEINDEASDEESGAFSMTANEDIRYSIVTVK
ncbi:MAG: hypothetical protein MJ194_07805 [Clostridia bacterium]|nr:hypothetical protein [Clostridia bacterium]